MRSVKGTPVAKAKEERRRNLGGKTEGEGGGEDGSGEGGGGIRDKEGEGKNGRTSPPVFTTYHRKSMIARTARFNEIPFPFLYMPPSPTLPSDHSSASCTRADVRICPAIHRLGQRMVKLKNLWRNLCPHGQDISTIYPPRQKLFVFASWIFERKMNSSFSYRAIYAAIPRRHLRSPLMIPFLSLFLGSHIDHSSLISRPISMSEQHRDIVYARERNESAKCYPTPVIPLAFVRSWSEKEKEKKNEGVGAKWKKKNRIIIHLVMFGQSFRPQQPP